MPRSRPFGNLTAWLVIVALFELVLHRLVSRLFLATTSCHSVAGCLVSHAGPFVLYLTGLLALILLVAGIGGLLLRGELLPRGVRITVTALGLVFVTLTGVALMLGHMPERYHTHLETSFGFVLLLLTLSFLGSPAPVRARAGLLLMVAATLMQVGATVLASRTASMRPGLFTPARLTAVGEGLLLLAAAAAPLLLAPRGISRPRLVSAVALGAGVTAFFYVALLGRYDLMQTAALYTLHLDVPHALSAMGAVYALALFGVTVTLALTLSGSGPERLAGYGLALVAIGGFQSASPVELALTLCGYLALATGIVRGSSAAAPLGLDAWRALVAAVGAAVADASAARAGAPRIDRETIGDADIAAVHTTRRARAIALRMRRSQGSVRELEVTIGAPGAAPPDATIEPHEAWLARAPEERLPLPRQKTGDRTFDRKLSVHGQAPLDDDGLRRRMLRHADGTVTLWRGSAARYRSVWDGAGATSASRLGAGPVAPRAIVEVVDTLIDLVEAGSAPASDPAPAPPPAAV